MILHSNSILTNGSGRLSNVVVKKYGDKYILAARPDMSRRKLSEKQKQANERMAAAIIVAKSIVADPRQKERACRLLEVTPNKVFRAIVSKYLLTDGEGSLFEETRQEVQDKQTLKDLTESVNATVPDGEITLFGERAEGMHNKQTDWNLLVLTQDDHPAERRWELQEKLAAIVLPMGVQVNLLLLQKDKWKTSPEYEGLRKRIGKP